MAEFKVDEALTKTVLAKRAQSIPLTAAEENYSRKLFDAMMSSKKSVQKTVRIVTGADLRKEKGNDLRKMQAEPTRQDPHARQVGTSAENDKPNAQPDTSDIGNEKLPDADMKAKEITTEEQRLSDITQTPVGNPTIARTSVVPTVAQEPEAKFVSADPIQRGDVVLKNFARVGQLIMKGTVLTVDSQNRATVKWQDGRQTFEWAHALVKAKASADAASVTPTNLTDVAGPPVKKSEVKKDGDIVPEAVAAQAQPTGPTPYLSTPFQDMIYSLQGVIGLAASMKECQARHEDDQEVYEYYGKMIDDLRGIAETVLSALSMELNEAQDENE